MCRALSSFVCSFVSLYVLQPSTAFPTASSAPTVSHVPTESPTITAVPTMSSMPSSDPSTTPTTAKESIPTYTPTAKGLEIVSVATDAPAAAAVPESVRTGGGVVHSTDFVLASMVLSVGGLLWLLV